MDYGIGGCVVPMRLWRDSSEETLVRWFRAEPGAKDYPGPHNFGRYDWWREDRRQDRGREAGPPPIGEVIPAAFVIAPPSPPAKYLGQKPCGRPEAFLLGAVHGVDAPMLVGPNGAVECCELADAGGIGLELSFGDRLDVGQLVALAQTTTVVYTIGVGQDLALRQLVTIAGAVGAVSPLVWGQVTSAADSIGTNQPFGLAQDTVVATAIGAVGPVLLDQVVGIADAIGAVGPILLGQLVEVLTDGANVQPLGLAQVVEVLTDGAHVQPLGLGQLVGVGDATGADGELCWGQTTSTIVDGEMVQAWGLASVTEVAVGTADGISLSPVQPGALGQVTAVAVVTGGVPLALSPVQPGALGQVTAVALVTGGVPLALVTVQPALLGQVTGVVTGEISLFVAPVQPLGLAQSTIAVPTYTAFVAPVQPFGLAQSTLASTSIGIPPTASPAGPVLLGSMTVVVTGTPDILEPTMLGQSVEVTYGDGVTQPVGLGQATDVLIDEENVAIIEATAFASAARTTIQTTASIANVNSGGLWIYLDVSNAPGSPGAGGLTIKVFTTDPVSGNDGVIFIATVAATAAGRYMYYLGRGAILPGGTLALKQVSGCAIPGHFKVQVAVGDAQSYTYSLGYALLP